MDPKLLDQARREWQELLDQALAGEPRCAPYRALLQAVLDADLARVFPYLSMFSLRLSLRPTYPWDQTGLPDIDYDPERPDCYQLDEAPSQSLAQTLAALTPLLQAAQPYHPEPETD